MKASIFLMSIGLFSKDMPKDLAGVARLIQSSECKNIAFLTGAGVSVASGIPDFRSPGGMYDTLRPELLTATREQQEVMRRDPTAVVERTLFLQNQFPYLEVRRPFIIGTRDHAWKATLAHHFASLLHTKTGKLTRVYTQNIDGLYSQCTALPADKIIPVHGTMSKIACENCGEDSDFDEFCDEVKLSIKDIYGIDKTAPRQSTHVLCKACGLPTVKPATVMFGGSLPAEFFHCAEKDLPSMDLLIIAGTSLVVSPANSLAYSVPSTTIRLIVNNEPVGETLGIDYSNEATRDIFAQGDCENVFLDLMSLLGWESELASLCDRIPDTSSLLVQKRLKELSQRN